MSQSDGKDNARNKSRRDFIKKLAQGGLAAGTGIAIAETLSPIPHGVYGPTDQLVKVSSSDTTPDFLNNKLTVQGITKRIKFVGSNEKLEIAGIIPARYVIFKDALGDVTSYKWDGTEGITTKGTADALINAAIQDCYSQGGGKVFIRNAGSSSPYLTNSQIVFRPYVHVESDGATLKNNATGTAFQFPFVSPSDQILSSCKLSGLVLDANNTANGTGLIIYSAQRSAFDLFVKNCVTGVDIRTSLTAPPDPVLGIRNVVFSEFNFQIDNIVGTSSTYGVAMQLMGDSGAPVTDNHFKFLYATRVGGGSFPGEGIRIVQWCDSNKFDNAFISLNSTGSFGVVFNDVQPGQPGPDAGVYDLQFDKLSVDSFPPPVAAAALRFNTSHAIQIGQFFTSGVFTTRIDDQGATSFEIGDYVSSFPTIVRRQKNVVFG